MYCGTMTHACGLHARDVESSTSGRQKRDLHCCADAPGVPQGRHCIALFVRPSVIFVVKTHPVVQGMSN